MSTFNLHYKSSLLHWKITFTIKPYGVLIRLCYHFYFTNYFDGYTTAIHQRVITTKSRDIRGDATDAARGAHDSALSSRAVMCPLVCPHMTQHVNNYRERTYRDLLDTLIKTMSQNWHSRHFWLNFLFPFTKFHMCSKLYSLSYRHQEHLCKFFPELIFQH